MLKDRLKQARKEAGLTQVELAEKAGITQQKVNSIESGRVENPRNLTSIANALGVSEPWLRYGAQDTHEQAAKFPVYNFGDLLDWDGESPLTPITHISLPFIATADTFITRHHGDSMMSPQLDASPVYPNGCFLVVEPSLEPKPGDCVLAHIPGTKDITFRKLVFDGGKTYLKPINTLYIMTEMTDDWKIIGVVNNALILQT